MAEEKRKISPRREKVKWVDEKRLFHQVQDLLLQFGKLAGYHVPDNRVVHVVIAMNEAISKANGLRTSIQLLKMIRETIPQSGTGLADHLEFSFDRGTAFRVSRYCAKSMPWTNSLMSDDASRISTSSLSASGRIE